MREGNFSGISDIIKEKSVNPLGRVDIILYTMYSTITRGKKGRKKIRKSEKKEKKESKELNYFKLKPKAPFQDLPISFRIY